MFNLLRTIRLTLKGISKMPEAKAVALGVAMGMAVGIVPKGNILALVLGVAMCSLRLSLVAAIATAVVVSHFGHHADPVFDAVGAGVLEWSPLRPFWVWAAHLPFADWMQFNNTVVCGSFLIAVASVYPVYRLLRGPFERYLPPVSDWVQRSIVMKVWSRFELAGRLSGSSIAGP